MRTFIGIDFDKETKSWITDIQSKVREQAIKGIWKYMDNFHITLKFLGETNTVQLQKIDAVLKQLSQRYGSMRLEINQLGCFPARDYIRVVWLGLGGEMDKLTGLQAEIDSNLKMLGFASGARKFSPHVTIAQDAVFHNEFEELKRIIPLGNITIRVEKFALIKSEQVANKRIYTPICEYLLV